MITTEEKKLHHNLIILYPKINNQGQFLKLLIFKLLTKHI